LVNILILYSELAGYFLKCLDTVFLEYNVNIMVLHWKINREAPFQFKFNPNISFQERNELSNKELENEAIKFNPDLILVSGWLDKEYVKIARNFKRKGIPVVCGLDNQWRGDFKQQIATWLSPLLVQQNFSYIWVSGIRQYEFARRLGYSTRDILTGYYCADIDVFHKVFEQCFSDKSAQYPQNLLYVGRFVESKGVKDLYNAFKACAPPEWRLTMVGAGPLRKDFSSDSRIVVKDFVQPESLPQLAKSVGAFILPSNFEPWGVVLHEFAAAGLPLLASSACGAATAFVKTGYNGYVFEAQNKKSLKKTLTKLFSHSSDQLVKMSERSYELSKQITPQSWAATLMSLVTI